MVPLNKVALAAIEKLRERARDGTGPVIRKPSGLEPHSCRKWFENCLADAGISDFRWHDLRHTFCTRLRRNGVSIEDYAALADHKIPSLRMVLRYAHADLEKLRAAVATLESKPVTEAEKTGTENQNETHTKRHTSPLVEFPAAKAV
ncbi:MAG TPA: tyrosine-type recombinase/integrase [Candidatus Acidoferrales bacterium]|nr:tyrosine-type recombinase/integrase [Candidatus Acidoferrales bacterium]